MQNSELSLTVFFSFHCYFVSNVFFLVLDVYCDIELCFVAIMILSLLFAFVWLVVTVVGPYFRSFSFCFWLFGVVSVFCFVFFFFFFRCSFVVFLCVFLCCFFFVFVVFMLLRNCHYQIIHYQDN